MAGPERVDVVRYSAAVRAWDRVGAAIATRSAETVASWPSVMAEMVGARNRLVDSGLWTAGPSTLMGVLDLSRAEVQNCRVLRWLLDPLARHGIGAALIERLCHCLGVAVSEPALARATVEMSRDVSRADVVLEGLTLGGVVVIEAKIDAPEGDRQAHRLETDWPEAKRLVFLTVPGGRTPITATEPERWRPMAWTWFADNVSELLDAAGQVSDFRAVDARRAATDWVAGVRRYLR